MNARKTVEKYSKLYQKALAKQGFSQIPEKTGAYQERLSEMLASPSFAKDNVYPSMQVELVYAVIAMCLELRGMGLSNPEIQGFLNAVFAKRRQVFDFLIQLVDRLPNGFSIVRKWNIDDHAKREKDHSISYDYFHVTKNSVEYRISKCMYVEMFEAYGIRELCKIFCNTDVRCYGGLARQVRFIRHSDLSDGDCCFDEIFRKER